MTVYIGIRKTTLSLNGEIIEKVFTDKEKAEAWKKESVARFLIKREVSK